MQLYTVVLDHGGGTYVTQVQALSEGAAFREWLSKLRCQRLAGAASSQVADAFDNESDELVRLDGLVSVWCASAGTDHGLALANVVRTDASPIE